jgi:hypothetical protein
MRTPLLWMLLCCAACRSSSAGAGAAGPVPPPMATPVAAGAAEAATASEDAGAAAQPTPETGAAAATVPGTCAALCGRVWICAQQVSGKSATEADETKFMAECQGTCANESAAKLAKAQACLDEAGERCADLFPCLERVP